MCKCADEVNAKLAAEGLELPMVAMMDMETRKTRHTVFMQTERSRTGSKVKRRKIIPIFCPFCGNMLRAA